MAFVSSHSQASKAAFLFWNQHLCSCLMTQEKFYISCPTYAGLRRARKPVSLIFLDSNTVLPNSGCWRTHCGTQRTVISLSFSFPSSDRGSSPIPHSKSFALEMCRPASLPSVLLLYLFPESRSLESNELSHAISLWQVFLPYHIFPLPSSSAVRVVASAVPY